MYITGAFEGPADPSILYMRSEPELEPKPRPGIAWTLTSADAHWFSVPRVFDGGELWPHHMCGVKDQVRHGCPFWMGGLPTQQRVCSWLWRWRHPPSQVIQSWVGEYEQIERRHQPSAYSSSFCRGEQIRVVRTVNLPALPSPSHFPKASYCSLSFQLPTKETKL